MFRVAYVDSATDVVAVEFGWGRSYNASTGEGDIGGVWYTREPIPIHYERKVTGTLTRLPDYGDSRQSNHGIDHVDVDGEITPRGTALRDGHIMGLYREHEFAVLEPGTYSIKRWEYPKIEGRPGTGRLVIYEKTAAGAVICDVSYSWDPHARSSTEIVTFNICCLFDDHQSNRVALRRFSARERMANNYKMAVYRSHIEASAIRVMYAYSPEDASTSHDYRYFGKQITLLPFRLSDKEAALAIDRLKSDIPHYAENRDIEVSLYKTCLEGQNCFTSNGIAYAADLKKTGDSIRALLQLVADPLSPRMWASAWLSMRFGDRLQARDSIELVRSVRTRLGSLVQAIPFRETHAVLDRTYEPTPQWQALSVTHRSRLRCDNESYNVLMTSIKKFMDWDVWLTLENAWDLIPLSFVVDWFFNLETILSNIDAVVYEQYLRVRFYERSVKLKMEFQPDRIASSFGLISTYTNIRITGKRYLRYSANRPKISWADGWEPGKPMPANYVDSFALIIQTFS